MEGSGGLGAVSIGISEPLIALVVLVLLVFLVWKIGKLVWAMFAG